MKHLTLTFFILLFSQLSLAQTADLSKLFATHDEFLDVDDAFKLSVDVFDNELIASWKVAPGYYLYQHRLKAIFTAAELGQPILPEGKHKVDEYFGEVQIYQKQLEISFPYSAKEPIFLVELEFQGCAEAGLCYPPTSRYFEITPAELKSFKVDESAYRSFADSEQSDWAAPPLKSESVESTTDSTASSAVEAVTVSPESAPTKAKFVSEKDQIIGVLNDSTIVGFITLIALGIGLAFTPCVFPMMPIISSIIAGEGKDITTTRAFTLSVVYTQFMAIPYVGIGFAVAYLGSGFTATLQSPIAVSIAAAIFLILSLGMFGFFEIQLPTGLQNKLNNISQSQKGGSYVGAAIMGVVSGAVVSPCVTIPLIAVLTWISQVGDAVTGAFYLYGLALGMGIPLILIGVGGGKLLPNAGHWMNAVKSVFGVMMIAVALYITKHLLPGPVNLVLWGTLAIVSAIFMGALRALEHADTGWTHFWKGIGIVLLIYGATLIIGAAQGNNSILRPLGSSNHGVSATDVANQTTNSHAGFTLIKSSADLDRYLAIAKAENKTVMLDFFAEYCAACYEFA
ncbi:MAG: protein-disulfide reductase DsbD, partial [Kangiellaceae bacterium]|nr:protein-disulfide reductase DsbD [Kangiellaceae bacterium]